MTNADDVEDLRVQATGHNSLINALFIALPEKGGEITVLIDASVASFDAAGDPVLAKATPVVAFAVT